MIYQYYPQYTSEWTNVRLLKPITQEQVEWISNHEGGMYHIHNSAYAIKFEREQDAEWFALRWL